MPSPHAFVMLVISCPAGRRDGPPSGASPVLEERVPMAAGADNAGPHEKDAAEFLYVRWLVSKWCNYRCSYCFFQDHRRGRAFLPFGFVVRHPRRLGAWLKRLGRGSAHAFDNFPAADWICAFRRLAPRTVSIALSGGEPFLDRAPFREVLVALTGMEHVTCVRCDTNGSWRAADFDGVRWEKVAIDVSYHPEMVSLDRFAGSVREKLSAGVRIAMINYVMYPDRPDTFLELRERMDELGLFTNANFYQGPMPQSERARALCESLVPEVDLALKSAEMATRGLPCAFPSRAYEVDATGMVRAGCSPGVEGDFIRGDLPELPDGPVPCPRSHCRCLDMYAFLERVDRAHSADVLGEYVEACRAHRTQTGA